jgi:AcrR family transcriptional regulator
MVPSRSDSPKAFEPILERGRLTRYRIIEETARLCVERRGAELSVAEIASAAGVFPNQITYYFGSKDSLLVHAAFLGLLHDAKRIEQVGESAPDAYHFRTDVAHAVLSLPSLPPVTRALAAGISRPELASVVNTHLKLLFRQSERYLRRLTAARGWELQRSISSEVRTFWSAALGAMLLLCANENGASSSDLDLAGMMSIDDQHTADRIHALRMNG